MRRWVLVLVGFIGLTQGVSAQPFEVGGSSTVYPISLVMAEEYAIRQPGVGVIVEVNGTGGGFDIFCAGDYPLTGASRPIKPDEIEACRVNGTEFVELPVAFDALSVVVNPDITFTDCLNTDQLRALFAPDSDIQTWRDLDPAYPDEPFTFFVPGVASGTYDYFTETIVESEEVRTDVLASEDDTQLVAGLSDNPFSIGYFGYAYYFENQGDIKALSIDSGEGCVAPSTETILDGSYTPLSRPLFIYINAAALENENVAAFAELYLLDETHLFIEELGYALLSEEAYELAQQRLSERVTGSAFQDFEPGMRVVDALE